MTRRASAALASALAVTAALAVAACGDDGTSDGGAADSGKPTGTIRVAALQLGPTGDQDPLRILIRRFEEANPGTTVKYQALPFDQYSQTLRAQVNAGSPPDVMESTAGYGTPIATNELGSIGALSDLSDEPWASGIPERYRSLIGVDGKVMGFPPMLSMIGLVYDPAVFDDLGVTPPKTFDEVLAMCRKVKAAGKVPIALGAQTAVTVLFPGYALAASTAYADDPDLPQKRLDGETTFAESGWEQSLEQYQQMNEEGCFGPSVTGVSMDAANNAVATGKAASTIVVLDFVGGLRGLNPRADWKMVPFPGNASADLTRIPYSVAATFGVPTKAKNPELAKAFVAFLAERENAIAYSEGVGSIPLAHLEGSEPQLPEAIEAMAPFLTPERSVVYMDKLWPSADVMTAYMKGVQQLLSDQASPGDVVKAMDDAWRPAS